MVRILTKLSIFKSLKGLNIMKNFCLALLASSLIFGCASPEKEKPTAEMKHQQANDVHSFAKPEEAKVTHLDLVANVDFDSRQISGLATYDIWTADDAKEIILDIDGLVIEDVMVDGETVEYSIGDEIEMLGQPLSIPVSATSKQVSIKFASSPSATALFWAEPEQTYGKEWPFLFTQSQAILARTWLPCQDSPGIRFTYTAEVTVPEGLMALMSAENPTEKNADGVYSFEMDQAIPAYLMALAVGDIAFESVGARTGVYAEPGQLEAAAYEFGQMEDMLLAAEELYGPYAWDRYDLIVLPPSFPFGGMENPRLTFCTPTIIAGDRSLTALVAHELAHSWSGNLVTNATWDDFWLNEGFTVYFERRIMEAVYGKDYAEMLASLGYRDLKGTLEDLSDDPKDTHLKLDLEGRNPDDGMTDIAYEKGYLMLRTIEHKVGRERFDKFLRTYFNKFAFKVMDTEQFVEYMNENLFKGDVELAQELAVKEWIYGPGIPDNAYLPDPSRFTKVEQAIEDWDNGTIEASEINIEGWTSQEWQHFISTLPEDVSKKQMQNLEETFKFSESGNSEILAAWFKLSIKKGFTAVDDKVEAFLVKVGRRKFLTPLYRAMVEAGRKDWALEIYEKARPGYHAVSTQTMDELLGYEA